VTETDLRRLGMIQVEKERTGVFRLTINGVLWASVEWSGTRSCWCVEDAVNQCLIHVDHIHGEHVNAETAIKLAKRMIRDGRMPTPEEARRRLEDETESAARGLLLGEQRERVLVPINKDA
jgi:hypothetical protein